MPYDKVIASLPFPSKLHTDLETGSCFMESNAKQSGV